jgi:guanylate kinase
MPQWSCRVKHYKVTVTLTTGFTYSYVCLARFLEGMKKNSQSYWTKTLDCVEITSEEYQKFNEVVFDEEPKKVTKKLDNVLRESQKKSGKIVDKGKLVTPKFSSLENFFEGEDEKPKRKKK